MNGELSQRQVSVMATSIGKRDWYACEECNTLIPKCRPFVALSAIPGSDISDVVEAVVDYVDGFVLDEMVFGMIRPGEFTIASFRVGVADPSAVQIYICAAQLEKAVPVTTPNCRRCL